MRAYMIEVLESINYANINESSINGIRKLFRKERWSYVYEKYNY